MMQLIITFGPLPLVRDVEGKDLCDVTKCCVMSDRIMSHSPATYFEPGLSCSYTIMYIYYRDSIIHVRTTVTDGRDSVWSLCGVRSEHPH